MGHLLNYHGPKERKVQALRQKGLTVWSSKWKATHSETDERIGRKLLLLGLSKWFTWLVDGIMQMTRKIIVPFGHQQTRAKFRLNVTERFCATTIQRISAGRDTDNASAIASNCICIAEYLSFSLLCLGYPFHSFHFELKAPRIFWARLGCERQMRGCLSVHVPVLLFV